MKSEASRLRPGGRSARVRVRVRQATLELLAERGFAALTRQEVANRAAVTRATIYKWWPTKGSLVVDALQLGVPATGEVPDLGSLEADLTAIGLSALRAAPSAEMARAITRSFEEGAADPEVAALRRAVWTHRRRAIAAVIDRARARGEIRGDADGELVADALWGATYVQMMIHGEEPTEAGVRSLARLMVEGLRSGRPE